MSAKKPVVRKKVVRKQVVLRLESTVNSSVRAAAKKAGQSINAYAETVLGRASKRAA